MIGSSTFLLEYLRTLHAVPVICSPFLYFTTGIGFLIRFSVKSSIAAIEDSLKAEMLAKNTDVLSGKDYLITWKTIITNRFDSAAFKLTHADLFNQFSRSTTTRRFVIA